jgi:hypothetical protein
VRAAEPGQAGADDRDAGARAGGARGLEVHAGDDGCRGGSLGEEPAAGEQALLALTGDLVDRHLAPLGLRVGREELAEVPRQRGVRDRAGAAHAAATLTADGGAS